MYLFNKPFGHVVKATYDFMDAIYIYFHYIENEWLNNGFSADTDSGSVGRVFANDPRDLCSIPGRVIPKTLKWYLIPPFLTLSNIRYAPRVKWRNPGKGVEPFPTPRCSSYWKGSFLVALEYGRQLYFLLTYDILLKIQLWCAIYAGLC